MSFWWSITECLIIRQRWWFLHWIVYVYSYWWHCVKLWYFKLNLDVLWLILFKVDVWCCVSVVSWIMKVGWPGCCNFLAAENFWQSSERHLRVSNWGNYGCLLLKSWILPIYALDCAFLEENLPTRQKFLDSLKYWRGNSPLQSLLAWCHCHVSAAGLCAHALLFVLRYQNVHLVNV